MGVMGVDKKKQFISNFNFHFFCSTGEIIHPIWQTSYKSEACFRAIRATKIYERSSYALEMPLG